MHPRLDRLLRPLLQVGAGDQPAPDRLPPDQMGATQVQVLAAAAEAGTRLARARDQDLTRALRALEASVCGRPDTGSRMSREVHVRFWESAGVRLPRATRLPLYRQSQIFGKRGRA